MVWYGMYCMVYNKKGDKESGNNARLRATAIGLPVAVKLFVGHVVVGGGCGGSSSGGRHDGSGS